MTAWALWPDGECLICAGRGAPMATVAVPQFRTDLHRARDRQVTLCPPCANVLLGQLELLRRGNPADFPPRMRRLTIVACAPPPAQLRPLVRTLGEERNNLRLALSACQKRIEEMQAEVADLRSFQASLVELAIEEDVAEAMPAGKFREWLKHFSEGEG